MKEKDEELPQVLGWKRNEDARTRHCIEALPVLKEWKATKKLSHGNEHQAALMRERGRI